MHVHGAPGFVGGVADIFEGTVDAFGFARDAEFAAVPDDLVGEKNPFFPRDDAHQILLDFLRVIVGGEFQAAGDAVDVGVDDDAFGHFEPRTQHDIRSFAGNSRKREEIRHVKRNLAAEVSNDFLGRAHHGFRFVAEEAGRADVGLELFGSERGEGFEPWDICGRAPA